LHSYGILEGGGKQKIARLPWGGLGFHFEIERFTQDRRLEMLRK
jgi:hypothetical protein